MALIWWVSQLQLECKVGTPDGSKAEVAGVKTGEHFAEVEEIKEGLGVCKRACL